MKKFILLLNIFLIVSISSCKASHNIGTTTSISTQKEKPHITILATGGTIAGEGSSKTKAGYSAGQKPIEDLLNAVPEIHNIAKINGEQVANIGSQDMNIETWLKLSHRINTIFENDKADGIVITHGTDTMEETAYFLSLTVSYNKPVVLVGAMRPATALSQDGNRNLLDAVIVAAASESAQVGTIVVMDGKIFSARDVDKTNTISTSAFQSRNYGPMGTVFDGKVDYRYKPLRQPKHIFDVKSQETLPQVDILYGYADARPDAVGFSMKFGARGIVYAGVGNGNFSQDVQNALAKVIKEDIVVVRASRIGSGKVTLNNEVDDEKYGFVVADDLSPQKARILLMLALTKTHNPKEIQRLFFEE